MKDFLSPFFRFSMCSQQVLKTVPNNPNVFPKTFPIVLHFLSHIVWTYPVIDTLPHCQVFRCTLPKNFNFASTHCQVSNFPSCYIGTHAHCQVSNFPSCYIGTHAHCQVFQVCKYRL